MKVRIGCKFKKYFALIISLILIIPILLFVPLKSVDAGTVQILSDETPPDGLIGPNMAGVRDTISLIGMNLQTDTGDILISVDMQVIDITNFNPNNDVSQVWIYRDNDSNPSNINGIWDQSDMDVTSSVGSWIGGPPIFTTTIILIGGETIPSDDLGLNESNDYFLVLQSSTDIADGDQFKAGIPTGGTATSSGILAESIVTQTLTCDDLAPNLYTGITDILSVTSDKPSYFDEADTNNLADGYFGNSDSIYFNDYPGEGSEQIITITLDGYDETYAYSFYGATTYYNENPIDIHPGPPYPYSGPFSLTYNLTWTEADTLGGIGGINEAKNRVFWLEDRVGHRTDYMNGYFYFIQDDDTPMSVVDFASSSGDEVWYYDESLSGNYLPYVDENNVINVYSTDQWWILDPKGGSGFDKPSSYSRYRVGVVREGATLYWAPNWQPCIDENPVPTGVDINVQTQIITDMNIGGGTSGPHGYYFIEFDSIDDVGNTIRIGDGNYEINVPGHPAGVKSGPANYFDTNRIYFKIAMDYSQYYGSGDTTNGYSAIGSKTLTEVALSVSDLDIPLGSMMQLYDTEIFLDSSFPGERHVDVSGTLVTGKLTNAIGYDGRTAITRRGLTSFYGGPIDDQYSFWVRNGATLSMSNTVIEGCGYTFYPLNNSGLYIRDDNFIISSSEFRYNLNGLVIEHDADGDIINSKIWENFNGIMINHSNGGTPIEIINCDIYDSIDNGIYIINSSPVVDLSKISNSGDAGVLAIDGSSPLIENCTLSNTDDIDLDTNSHATTLNSTFDKTNVIIDTSSTLTVQWYLHVKVTDYFNTEVANANVNVEDNDNGTFNETYLTKSDGYRRWIVITEFWQNKSIKIYYTPHKITAWDGTLMGYADPNPFMNESKVINIILNNTTLLDLEPGWNLVSLPRIQLNTDIETVFQSIEGDYDNVQWYNITDNKDLWKLYHVSKPPALNDLNEINHTMGIWIHITNPTGTIFAAIGDELTLNQSIALYPGWNLVGYPSLKDRTRDEALNNIKFGSDVDSIWTYNATTPKWEEITASDNFELGRGYWIHSKVKKVWDVPL